MRPIYKDFFISLVIFLISFTSLMADQSGSQFDVLTKMKGDLIRESRGKKVPIYNSKSTSFFPMEENLVPYEEQKVMEAIFDDFLVNDDYPGIGYESNPAIDRDPSGNFIITWEDNRNGNYDIYARRYNSLGIPLGPSFKVNNDPGTTNQCYSSIAIDGSGNFVITWQDGRNDNYDIYAQRYNSSGTPLGSNYKVNDDVGTDYQGLPSIAMDGSGNFVIAWEVEHSGNIWNIYAQRYNSSGTPLGSNFKVNDGPVGAGQGSPAVAMGISSGIFFITWHDWRNGNADIYAERYNANGIPQGSNFKVNNDVGTNYQYDPAIASDAIGNVVITWEDSRNYYTTWWDIYAQRYNANGIGLGGNVRVNDDVGGAGQGSPAIARDTSFIITWDEDRNGNSDIYAQRYNSAGTAQGSNFKVNDDIGTAEQSHPAIAIDGFGKFVITWTDDRNYIINHEDIYAQSYNAYGNPWGSNFYVHDLLNANQESPDIALDGPGNFVITWEDYRDSSWNIYAQRCDSLGNPLGFNFKVNDDVSDRHYWPAITMNSSGYFVICWSDDRNGYPNRDIYAQRYDFAGVPLGANFLVNDNPGTAYRSLCDIAMDDLGNFIITWTDKRSDNGDIYAQIYNSSGTPIGSNFKVNDNVGFNIQEAPAIGMDGSGNFVITWHDSRSVISEIYAQRYNNEGTPIGSNFQVSDDSVAGLQAWPNITVDMSGYFVIAWQAGYNDIYAQRYNSLGSPLGSNFKVNDEAGIAYGYSPDITMNGSGNFIVTWQDVRNGNSDIYAQRYTACGTPLDSNYLVTDLPYANYEQGDPAVSANSSTIYYTWIDDRRVQGWDIYAKIVEVTSGMCGDVNSDGKVDVADINYLINYLMKGGPPPNSFEACDVNCDGKVSLSDVVYLINYLFKGGKPPCQPN